MNKTFANIISAFVISKSKRRELRHKLCGNKIVGKGNKIIVVGNGSIVTKVFKQEYTAIAGNPAKIVKREVTWDHTPPSLWDNC